MLSHIMQEPRVFRVGRPLYLGDDILLPAGEYVGWEQWVEMPADRRGPRSTKRRSLIELCAADIRRFGGDVSVLTEALTFDLTGHVQKGVVR
ncbi:hypothetical protein [Aureimonas leprariae]|uniref:Uncharacterized protein n=1 Tax=Plantimonas leprariae TaxID=2615207 RepID=A0A7V7PPW4_9HYPH|nr:hypothetical protein [Aureimonas leprariae]KAB0680074.1 hypothetical protein F6X38_09700 [Aureimonas leprariae]